MNVELLQFCYSSISTPAGVRFPSCLHDALLLRCPSNVPSEGGSGFANEPLSKVGWRVDPSFDLRLL